MRILVLGGARSGKSAFAEELVGESACQYVATARPWPGDEDFANRIAEHRNRRPAHWHTEDSRDAIEVLRTPPTATVLVDDLGTWLTHLIDSHAGWERPRGAVDTHIQELVTAIANYPTDRDVIIVSPEVGMGVIPEHRAGRLFRDELGRLNAEVATVCDQVVLVIAGQQLVLKHPNE